MLDCLARGDAVVLPFDQHAGPPDGIEVDFLGHPAWTFKSLAIIALSTGAPVLPASSWRESDGRHVLRFEAPLAPIECDNTSEAIRRNTRAYNQALERLVVRHPEQWYWVHRRWKHVEVSRRRRPPARRPERPDPAAPTAWRAGWCKRRQQLGGCRRRLGAGSRDAGRVFAPQQGPPFHPRQALAKARAGLQSNRRPRARPWPLHPDHRAPPTASRPSRQPAKRSRLAKPGGASASSAWSTVGCA